MLRVPGPERLVNPLPTGLLLDPPIPRISTLPRQNLIRAVNRAESVVLVRSAERSVVIPAGGTFIGDGHGIVDDLVCFVALLCYVEFGFCFVFDGFTGSTHLQLLPLVELPPMLPVCFLLLDEFDRCLAVFSGQG